MKSDDSSGDEPIVPAQINEARSVVIYLVAKESSQYIAIMDVLEASITDLTPDQVVAHLRALGILLDQSIVEARLDKLREWGAVSARTDSTRILRYVDLLARNWRYTATPAGRQVQRFYRKVLASTSAAREIPLSSLARVVEAAQGLSSDGLDTKSTAELIGRLFVNQDDLDSALVGAEESLASLVNRYDLNHESAAELKTLLVGYATRVAVELERGSARVHKALQNLKPRFREFAMVAVQTSEARQLIERGALGASHGGRPEDWDALLAWFDPSSGRATRFALRLVRAIPGMQMNLRRLHSSSGTATSRGRALALARASLNPTYGPAILMAALGDHPWRKFHGEAEEIDGGRMRPWRIGPKVAVPELLRATGHAGARGKAPAARDDSVAREHVRLFREKRAADHSAAIQEVLSTDAGARMSDRAATVALVSLLAAIRATTRNGRRTDTRNGLACTVFPTSAGGGMLSATTWHVQTPGRIAVFHLPGVLVDAPSSANGFGEQKEPNLADMGAP